jgi:hypothetical protein
LAGSGKSVEHTHPASNSRSGQKGHYYTGIGAEGNGFESTAALTGFLKEFAQ